MIDSAGEGVVVGRNAVAASVAAQVSAAHGEKGAREEEECKCSGSSSSSNSNSETTELEEGIYNILVHRLISFSVCVKNNLIMNPKWGRGKVGR